MNSLDTLIGRYVEMRISDAEKKLENQGRQLRNHLSCDLEQYIAEAKKLEGIREIYLEITSLLEVCLHIFTDTEDFDEVSDRLTEIQSGYEIPLSDYVVYSASESDEEKDIGWWDKLLRIYPD